MSSLTTSEFTIDEDISGNALINRELQTLLVPFWSDNPNVLFQSKYIGEFFPVDSMTYNQKLNAVTRTVIVLTILSFLYARRVRVIVVGIVSLAAIFAMHYYHTKENSKVLAVKKSMTEGFSSDSPALEVLKGYPIDAVNTFDAPSSSNPFSNVLLPDYDYNPEKKPAPPSFNTNVNQSILDQAKQLVVEQNPGQPDIANKLFKDLGEQFEFEQSLQPFYSNAATTIPNDQAGFADFCYGSMVSCKEGNLFACARNLERYTN
jgi:hypothetical protein